MRSIIEISQIRAYRAVDTILVKRNWMLGRRIAKEVMKGNDRAEYGMKVIAKLSRELTNYYGRGFTKTNLYSFFQFYEMYPEIFHSLNGKSEIPLSWTHYRTLIQVKDKTAREWYEKEAYQQTWSVRTLQRNIDTQYYYRLLSSQNMMDVENEMKQNTVMYQNDKYEYLKNPIIAEFLGLSSNVDMTETELESAILTNIQKFIMEIAKPILLRDFKV